MNCEAYTDAIGDLVDGLLDERRQRDLDAHLAECASCRALVSDLVQIRAVARELPAHRPPERVWTRLSARLPVAGAQDATPTVDAARGWWASLTTLMVGPRWRVAWGAGFAVALVAVAIFVGLPYLRPVVPPRQPNVQPSTPTVAATPGSSVHANDADLVKSVESELQLAEQHYEKAIAGLEQITKAGEGTLDPQLAGTLRRNLGVIDQAIHDSRVALQSQPTNQLAQESLFEAFRRKVGLLQDTVTLINEMRKGNQAEAAKIIGTMQKS